MVSHGDGSSGTSVTDMPEEPSPWLTMVDVADLSCEDMPRKPLDIRRTQRPI